MAGSTGQWESSGLAALVGRPDRPAISPPAGLVRFLETLQRRIGVPAGIDVYNEVGIRVETHGHRRRGTVSAGGATHLFPTADGWAALTLSRPNDLDLLSPWLEVDEPFDGEIVAAWPKVAATVKERSSASLLERAELLSLPFAVLGHHPRRAGVVLHPLRAASRRPRPLAGALVVDFSSLWAGPLCAHVLGRMGARVVKVESATRPDGARHGPISFYDRLHQGHESVVVDFTADDGRARLASLVERADIVIESSRPRAFAALGIDPLAPSRVGAWVSITGYGRVGPWSNRVAFGDDAAVAGGLVAHDELGPVFVGDAIADPLSGLVAAAAAVESWNRSESVLVDVAMASVAAEAVG